MPQLDFLTFLVQIVLSLSLIWLLIFNAITGLFANYIIFNTTKKTLWTEMNNLNVLRKWFACSVLLCVLCYQSHISMFSKFWCVSVLRKSCSLTTNFIRILVSKTQFPFSIISSFLNISLIENNVLQNCKSTFLILKKSTYNFVKHYSQLNLYSKMKTYRILVLQVLMHRVADDEAVDPKLLFRKKNNFSLIS